MSLRKANTGIGGLVGLARSGLGNIVETLWREFGATVGHINQQRAVATQRIGWAQQHHVGYGLHQASRIAWCFVDIGNHGVARIGGVDGNGGSRRDFYIRTDTAKAAPLKRRGTLQHFEGNHLGVSGQAKVERCNKRGGAELLHCEVLSSEGVGVLPSECNEY